MADFFGAIAANDIGFKRAPLRFPTPTPWNGISFPLSDAKGESPLRVPAKMSTREELDAEIEKLRQKYEPFMQDIAAECEKTRIRTDLRNFDYRVQTEADKGNILSVFAGEGEWESVTIPHYQGPVGDKTAYYRTEFEMGEISCGKAAFLHFDGVDYACEVYVNGNLAGTHEGFFAPFEFDISGLCRKGRNSLLVVVKNDYIYNGNNTPDHDNMRLEGDKMYAATGPGYDDAALGWHHCPPGMGIYQGVYTEIRDRMFISDLFVRPMPKSGEYEIWCEIYNCDYIPPKDVRLSFSVYGKNFEEKVLEDFEYTPITFSGDDNGNIIRACDLENPERMKEKQVLSFYRGASLVRLRMKMDNIRLWEQDTPYLYKALAALTVDGRKADCAERTFGMRSFETGEDGGKKGMFFLNGKAMRLRGANTMGYEQQDVMRGDFDMLLYDMLMAKACNMNFLRLTQRPVQKEIYELCDTIGLLIQTDLPLFTNMRRTKFASALGMCEDMERLIRPYACTVLISYMNEPFANASGKPHRHFVRHELEDFFSACDKAVLLLNPDRAIKHIDGDYDPPSTTLPDNHTYTMWYNGHGIDMGRVYRGYWLGVADGWYYGCGEYGAEGLDPVSLMRRRYPAEWLPQTPEEEKGWTPDRIVNSQSGDMSYFFYDRQDTLEGWVEASRRYQSVGTKLQTEAFRRNSDMVTFAIHLFIDAWPSGWMKTIVDCERNPKPAFYVFRDALTPLMVSLRTDRKTFFSGDKAGIEIWVCNDTHEVSCGHTLRAELINSAGELVSHAEFPADFGENSSFMQGKAVFTAPLVSGRENYIFRTALIDGDGNVLHYSDEPIVIFEREKADFSPAIFVTYEEFANDEKALLAKAESGETLVISDIPAGTYNIAGSEVIAKNCGMRPLHFVSRKTGHPLVSGFEAEDFRFWYNEDEDMMTPLLRATFRSDDFTPILTSGNSLRGSAWGQKLYPAHATAEKSYGKGKIILNQVDLDSHLLNPVALIFKNRLAKFR